MSEVNKTQVGGDHYRSSYQHWDFAADLRLNYFEGAITKYLARHHKKNKRQDLDKAVHFTHKQIELMRTCRAYATKTQGVFRVMEVTESFLVANQLHGDQAGLLVLCVRAHDERDWLGFASSLEKYREDVYPTHDGAEPCSLGYVNQDR